jgi:hypothetical protein
MKKRVQFKLPPTRRQREVEIVEGVLQALREAYPGQNILEVRQGEGASAEDYQAALAKLGAFKPGTFSAMVYQHDDGCPKLKEESCTVQDGESYPRHGKCTCNPEVVTFIPEEVRT